MRPAAAVVVAFFALALAPATTAAPPTVTIAATATAGSAPLAVTFVASGDAVSYRWDLGNGEAAEGATVTATYEPGLWRATVTAVGADGASAQASVSVRSVAIRLASVRGSRYGRPALVRGTIVPALSGERVALVADGRELSVAHARRDGSFRLRLRRLRGPGPYEVHTPVAASAPIALRVHPVLRVAFAGARAVGAPLALTARVRPQSAGTLAVRIYRNGKLVVETTAGAAARIPVETGRITHYRAVVELVPAEGWFGSVHVARAAVVRPRLALGSRGASVFELERRLASLHYALLGVDSLFGVDTRDAVLAFQKVHGFARTGRVGPSLWRRIENAAIPLARHGGNHVEVDKTRQVLFEVRSGKVVLVVPVSTGATGNTPLGLWHVYSRIPGWDWVLYYPSYFVRGFAIHGYPDVPPYPASHGCVRVPMWVATRIYGMQWYGEAVYVYS